jgi:hypothetical protein
VETGSSSDTDSNDTRLKRPLKKEDGTALDFQTLLQIGETNAVRFAKVMTCLNISCPLGSGFREGVPLRELIWQTQPAENLRRGIYYGYHNNDEKQMFRNSLPIACDPQQYGRSKRHRHRWQQRHRQPTQDVGHHTCCPVCCKSNSTYPHHRLCTGRNLRPDKSSDMGLPAGHRTW